MTSLILKNCRILVSCKHLVIEIAVKLSEAKLVLIITPYVFKSRNAIHNVNDVYFLCTIILKCNLLCNKEFNIDSVHRTILQTQLSETGCATVLWGKMLAYPCNKQEFYKNILQCSFFEQEIWFPRSILTNTLLLRTVCQHSYILKQTSI
jgi:hypothetical protein